MSEPSSQKRWGHVPVLAREVVEAFHFDRPVVLVDGTLGAGGHSERLLETYPQAEIIGLDWDRAALTIARERLARFGDRLQTFEWSYADLPALLNQLQRKHIDGVLVDLGLSSIQLDDTERGFSFLRPGPLDMRMSRALPRTAWDLLQRLPESDLAGIFRTYGEEPQSRKIAAEIKSAISRGNLKNDAWEIAEHIRRQVGGHQGRIDAATRCFQALRIAVNQELQNLQTLLSRLSDLLSPGGRAAIISFHSLEDRMVKRSFQQAAKGCVCPPQAPQCVCGQKPWAKLVVRKAIQARPEETAENPRSRSARLRVLERL